MQLSEEEYLLICLAEEGNEVGKELAKAQRFGLDHRWPNPDSPSVRERIIYEMNDLRGTLELLDNFSPQYQGSRELIEKKIAKVKHMMAYSRELGTLEQES